MSNLSNMKVQNCFAVRTVISRNETCTRSAWKGSRSNSSNTYKSCCPHLSMKTSRHLLSTLSLSNTRPLTEPFASKTQHVTGHSRRQVHTYAQSREGGANSKTQVMDVRERSVLVNEDLLMFFFLSDLKTRLQRAENLEQQEVVVALQQKIKEVEGAMSKKRSEVRGAEKKEDVTDRAALQLQLRSELQRAIDEERYDDAATIRDRLSVSEMDSLAASLTAAAASQSREFPFRLGERIVHKADSWQGVICGMDGSCFETEEWQQRINVDELKEGIQQPFYQVLVDSRGVGDYDVAYVPEERLRSFQEVQSEMDEVVEALPVEHPYTYLLFFGMDKKGNYIPTRNLRDKYNAERYIDPSLMEEDNDDDGSSSE